MHRGLEGINLVAADIVEVAVSLFLYHNERGGGILTRDNKQPAYDTNAEHTTMAAADALYEIMSIMVKKG